MKNLKFLFFALTLMLSIDVYSDCIEQLLEFKNLSSLPEKNQQCVKESEDFLQSLELLCNGDQSDFSQTFQVYLEYKAEVDQAIEEIKAATTPREKAIADRNLSTAQQNWNLAGHRNMIDAQLFLISRSDISCREE